MHFILEGRVGIIVDLGEGRTMRVRSLGRHTTIGEMGLITHRPRSATIQAEAASVLYELSADAYEKIKSEQPELSQALLGYVVAVMAERLSFANRVDRCAAALTATGSLRDRRFRLRSLRRRRCWPSPICLASCDLAAA